MSATSTFGVLNKLRKNIELYGSSGISWTVLTPIRRWVVANADNIRECYRHGQTLTKKYYNSIHVSIGVNGICITAGLRHNDECTTTIKGEYHQWEYWARRYNNAFTYLIGSSIILYENRDKLMVHLVLDDHTIHITNVLSNFEPLKRIINTCVDCGTRTPNRRCSRCKAKFLEDNGHRCYIDDNGLCQYNSTVGIDPGSEYHIPDIKIRTMFLKN